MLTRLPLRHVLIMAALVGTVSGSQFVATTPAREDGARRAPQAPSGSRERQIADVLQETLQSGLGRIGSDARNRQYVLFFYAARGYTPAWQYGSARDAARVLIERMAAADQDGLSAADYTPDVWRERTGRVPSDLNEFVALDIDLTAVIFRFASELALGPATDRSARGLDLVGLLASARDARTARQAIEALEPVHDQYRHLKRALKAHRDMAARGGWPLVPGGPPLKPAGIGRTDARAPKARTSGQQAPHDRLRALCERLEVTGDLTADPWGAGGCDTPPGTAAEYNTGLQAAVLQFQSRHGIHVDGVVGPGTVAALNVPVDARIRQIIMNMHRWRRFPDNLGDPHVAVNIAGFSLVAVEGGRPTLAMRVVSGEPDSPTPIMSDVIEYLEFRPYWNVPESITRTELLPLIARNPSYLHQQHFEVVDGWDEEAQVVDPISVDWEVPPEAFPYRLRQRPGPQNALGLVKFMFPNPHNIYLHDTPSTHRFDELQRAFSHGCIRVEDPVALAAFLLRTDPAWSPDAIRAAMQGEDRRIVRLPARVPVHLTYFTAWVEDGEMQFRADLYGLDAADAPQTVAAVSAR